MKVPAKSNTGIDARQIAVRIFRSILDERRTLDDLLEHDDSVKRLEARDRAFLNNLLRTAFRHLGEIEAIKTRHVAKPLHGSLALRETSSRWPLPNCCSSIRPRMRPSTQLSTWRELIATPHIFLD